MKTKKIENKFNLRKITIVQLSDQEMHLVLGRDRGSQDFGCPTVSLNSCPENM